MKRLIFYFLILLGSIWLGLKIHKDPGYVLITYQHWSLETTLWFALLALIVLFLLLIMGLRILRGTTAISGKITDWLAQRRLLKAHAQTYKGLCALAEGEWKSAEKNLVRGAEKNETPLVNYLAAANAAQQQGHFDQRDAYLRLAHQCAPHAELAIGLTQAQLQLSAEQWELALATLRHLQHLAPNHLLVLQLLKRVYVHLQDWQSLEQLFPILKKEKAFSPEALEQLQQQIYSHLLASAIALHDSTAVNALWEKLPGNLSSDPHLVSQYVDFLLARHQAEQAENLLRKALRKEWHADLIQRYGLTHFENGEKQISQAESWLKAHPQDPALLACLGRLYARQQWWQKARDYLFQSLQIQPDATLYHELGQLLQQHGETQAALDCYAQGLQAPSKNSPTTA
jgi:HemY protein